MSCLGNRLFRLQEAIRAAGAGAAYIRDTANIEWLTGFSGVFDEERAHAAFVPAEGDSAKLHTDSRYITAMQREAQGSPFEVDAEVVGMAKWASRLASPDCRYGEGAKAGDLGSTRRAFEPDPASESMAESGLSSALASSGTRLASPALALAIEDSISLAEYRDLQKAFGCEGSGSPFIETHDMVLKLRAVKDAEEISRMKGAQAVTDAAFDHICGFIKPGMTEREIQLELDSFMMGNGAEALAFPSIVASGSNGASPHAIVSDKPIQQGECIVMDFGARKDGYCSDMTRTVFIGRPEGEMLKAWNVLRHANESVEEMLKPGITGVEAHRLAEKVLADGGFAGLMGHGLGHGVGIMVHELPNLNTRNEKPLAAGNVVTVEPGIYIPGKFGMRLEDFGVVTDQGFEVFTRSTHEMVVL